VEEDRTIVEEYLSINEDLSIDEDLPIYEDLAAYKSRLVKEGWSAEEDLLAGACGIVGND
jgi:hypothetical protein